MDRSKFTRDTYDRLNKRDPEMDDLPIAANVKAHIPGFGIDTLEGRETILSTVRGIVEKNDVTYEVLETAELGPFSVGYVRGEGTIGGERRSWELLQVGRWDGDEVTEMWSLRA